MLRQLALLMLLFPLALADSMDIGISLAKNDVVTETITLQLDDAYDSVSFTTVHEPISVLYENDFSVSRVGDDYQIILYKNPDMDNISFSLVHEGLVQGYKDKSFRTSFYPSAENVHVTITLPVYHVLSDVRPNTSPDPNSITSDGQRITLSYDFSGQDEIDIVVFYNSQSNSALYLIILSAIGLVLVAYYLFRRKSMKDIQSTLSKDELRIIEQVRTGNKKQKYIAKEVGFSKSKMSKVVAKLEKKGLIEKEPYFKTNIIKLSGKVK